MRGIDYGMLFPPNLNPIPLENFIKAWEGDYRTMQTNMIPEDSPSFTDHLETVKQATQEYNALKFEYMSKNFKTNSQDNATLKKRLEHLISACR